MWSKYHFAQNGSDTAVGEKQLFRGFSQMEKVLFPYCCYNNGHFNCMTELFRFKLCKRERGTELQKRITKSWK